VKAGNILFDAERSEVEQFSAKKWAPTADVVPFTVLLYEIAVGRPAVPPIGGAGELAIPAGVPEFLSRIIAEGRSPECQCRLSFVDIANRLNTIPLEILAGVDSEEVSVFIARVESAEQSGNWE
jgi:hypothetical protein